jgi:hypothetical protein
MNWFERQIALERAERYAIDSLPDGEFKSEMKARMRAEELEEALDRRNAELCKAISEVKLSIF